GVFHTSYWLYRTTLPPIFADPEPPMQKFTWVELCRIGAVSSPKDDIGVPSTRCDRFPASSGLAPDRSGPARSSPSGRQGSRQWPAAAVPDARPAASIQ